MLLRGVDASGDILPVLSSRVLLSGPEAVARLAEYRLSLLAGEWWENAGMGFSILEVMRSARLTGGIRIYALFGPGNQKLQKEICTQKSSRPNVTANELSHITGSGLSGTGSVTE